MDLTVSDVMHYDSLQENTSTEKPKSSLRLIYAAEIKVFRSQHGGLEDIRKKLGFSRRKMCQLLMVDPSAWTRWTKDESRVPPHIYRALEWFLALNSKALTHPELAAVFTNRYRVGGNVNSQLEVQVATLERELKKQQAISWFLSLAGVAMALSLGYLFWH